MSANVQAESVRRIGPSQQRDARTLFHLFPQRREVGRQFGRPAGAATAAATAAGAAAPCPLRPRGRREGGPVPAPPAAPAAAPAAPAGAAPPLPTAPPAARAATVRVLLDRFSRFGRQVVEAHDQPVPVAEFRQERA